MTNASLANVTLGLPLALALLAPACARAQEGSQRIMDEITSDWTTEYHQVTGAFRMVSPAYSMDGACVITIIDVPSTRDGRPNFPLLTVEREILVGPERIDCSAVNRADFATIHRDPPLPPIVDFMRRVVAGPDAGSRVADGTDPEQVARCMAWPWGGRARVVSVGQPIIDNEDMDQFSATIHCAELPEGHRIVARGQHWSGGHMLWIIAGPPIHPR